MQVKADVELVVDAKADLGEGPVWDDRAGALLWVDITAGHLHKWEPDRGQEAVDRRPAPLSAVIPRASGGHLLATGHRLVAVDGDAEEQVALLSDEPADTRLNDAKCDPQGRLWAGTMADDARPGAGTLYRISPGGEVVPVVREVTISNGLGWSPAGDTMYYVDTMTLGIDAFDFDPATGAASGRRTIVRFPEDEGLPDGMCVDAEGCVWVALWGGWSVRRYTPDGALDAVVRLPAAQVTSCAFGGPGFTDLYITTARMGLDADELAGQPQAGGLFRARPGVNGVPATPFAG